MTFARLHQRICKCKRGTELCALKWTNADHRSTRLCTCAFHTRVHMTQFSLTSASARSFLKASRRGQDKRGRHRSVTIPHYACSLGNVSKLWQHSAKCDKMWQHVRTQKQIWQNVRNLRPFCENPVCPDPVWKPVTSRPAARPTSAGPRRGRLYYITICIYIYIYI